MRIDGRRVEGLEPADRGIAMVFQSYALYPHMSVEQNLGFGLKMNGAPKERIAAGVAEAARILQLGPLLKRKPAQLSGGQRQRVAIGRAIVREPKVFLFDEPLSNLDAELRVQMRVEIAKLHQQLGNTMIYVTHDQTEAMTLADKIVVLRAGRVEQVGRPLDLYENPDNAFVAGFIGSPRMNFFDATVEGDGAARAVRVGDWAPFAPPPAPGRAPALGPAKLGVRPEHFMPAAAGDVRFPAKVEVVERLGGTAYVHARAADGAAVVVERRDGETAKPGDTVEVGFALKDARLFDAEGRRAA
ncbi:MAG: ATP-binding cassette domain-containing protein, partial [Hyphomicrobiales bacterium]|nr:ATP-binding cassette domain-containing protein [Hyphomicrobiales bacterium]